MPDAAVKLLEPSAEQISRWNGFVRGHTEGTFFHLAEWKSVLERAFRHRTFYLYAEIDGSVEGVLPLGQIRSRLFGNALISTPFCVYGGPLATSERVRRALEQRALEIARDLRVDYLELRNRRRQHPDWPCKDLYVTFRKEIDADPEANLKAIPRKQRAMVRKGIKAALDASWVDDTRAFYRVYSESVRNLGTPVFSRRFFDVLKREFGESCRILNVAREGDVVGSVMSFFFRDEVLPYYGGGTSAARGVAANDFMYWEVMRDAASRGLRVFDYGRSKRDVGSYRFKKHWGFEPEPLYYEYYLVRAQSVPDVNPLNPKYRFFINTWRRLPLPVTHWIGPLISRNLG